MKNEIFTCPYREGHFCSMGTCTTLHHRHINAEYRGETQHYVHYNPNYSQHHTHTVTHTTNAGHNNNETPPKLRHIETPLKSKHSPQGQHNNKTTATNPTLTISLTFSPLNKSMFKRNKTKISNQDVFHILLCVSSLAIVFNGYIQYRPNQARRPER